MSVVVADTGAGKALADLRLVDDEGSLHRLGDAWAVRPTVLAFLRHYGCIFCRMRVAQLMKRSAEIRAAGAGLALLGRGSPPMAHAFREESGFRGAMYVDPEGKAYGAAGMVRGAITRFLRPRVLMAAWRARRKGFRQTKVAGDPYQLGGTLILAPGDRIVFAWRNVSAEDDAPVHDVLAALQAWAE